MNKKRVLWFITYLLLLTACSTSEILPQSVMITKAPILEEVTTEDLSDVTAEPITITEEAENQMNVTIDHKLNTLTSYIDINDDFVGFVTIPNTTIDFPVVKTNDNEYYLDHNFYKEEDRAGAIYMDYRNFGLGLDKNTIIYGHHMRDNGMFASLKNYMDYDYFTENNIIEVQDLYGTSRYKVFSAYYQEPDPRLITTQFTDLSFTTYLSTIINYSVHDTDYQVLETDDLLTLVTCSYDIKDGRYFIHAVKLNN